MFTGGLTKASSVLSTVCVVFHCVVVTLATVLVTQPPEPAPPVGRLHICVFWRDTPPASLQGCLLLGLYAGLKVTSGGFNSGTQKQLLFSIAPSYNFLLQCLSETRYVFACLFAISNFLLPTALKVPWGQRLCLTCLAVYHLCLLLCLAYIRF